MPQLLRLAGKLRVTEPAGLQLFSTEKFCNFVSAGFTYLRALQENFVLPNPLAFSAPAEKLRNHEPAASSLCILQEISVTMCFSLWRTLQENSVLPNPLAFNCALQNTLIWRALQDSNPRPTA